MKRITLIAAILLFTVASYAQKDTIFYKHEVRASVGDAIYANIFWTSDTWGNRKDNAALFANITFSYFYRPIKWLWVGGNFSNYFGEKIYYDWREYYPDGNYKDFEISKIKYCAMFAPEIRFSYLNKKNAILYSGFSVGVGFENGFDSKKYQYPQLNYGLHLTCFGFSINFGEKKNIFLGGELGLGFKGFGSIHGGYRF